jgi:hypothetical protein
MSKQVQRRRELNIESHGMSDLRQAAKKKKKSRKTHLGFLACDPKF